MPNSFRYDTKDISAYGVFFQSDQVVPAAAKVGVFSLINAPLLGERVPVVPVALNDKVSLGEEEVNAIPPKSFLRDVLLTKQVKDGLSSSLKAAGLMVRKRSSAAFRARSKPRHEAWLDQPDRATNLTGHFGFLFIVRMILACSVPSGLVSALGTAPYSLVSIPRLGIKRLLAPLTSLEDLRFPVGIVFAFVHFANCFGAAIGGAVQVGIVGPLDYKFDVAERTRLGILGAHMNHLSCAMPSTVPAVRGPLHAFHYTKFRMNAGQIEGVTV